MKNEALVSVALLVPLALLISCSTSPKRPDISTPKVVIEAQAGAKSANPDEQLSADADDSTAADEILKKRVRDFIDGVKEEVVLLRADGKRLQGEDDFEEARQAYDAALNVILNSGLALDAHPELAGLFKQISRDVIGVEDKIALLEERLVESTLVDDLENIEDVKNTGETKGVETTVTFDIPIVYNSKVQHFIERFANGVSRKTFIDGITRSGQFIEEFRRIFREEGVPEDLVYMAMIESTYKVNAYSRARAKGVWQFMTWTGKRYGLKIDWWQDERSDPFKSCRAAACFLRDLHVDLGDWLLAMAAYNGGPGKVGRAVKSMKTKDFWKISSTSKYLRRETRNFVPSILAATIIMKQPEKYGFGHLVKDKPWSFETVKIDAPIDLRVVADLAGISVSSIQFLNPALRRLISPQNYPGFQLRVPKGVKAKLEQKLAALPKSKRLKYTEHYVRRGDTLSQIAVRYGSSVTAIKQANSISNARRLRLGSHLIIPLSPNYKGSSSISTGSAKLSKGKKYRHVVRRGESLYTIARKYGTTVGSLAVWNSLNPQNLIHPGNRLTVYAYSKVAGTSGGTIVSKNSSRIVYKVKRGDTLYNIANKYSTTVSNIKRWNKLRRNLIRPGDRLTVYLGGSKSNY